MKKVIFLFIIFYSCSDERTINQTNGPLKKEDSVMTEAITPCHSAYDTVFTVRFNAKSIDISPAGIEVLKRVSDICASDSFCFLQIIGYTDTIGPATENYSLSEKRAIAVEKIIDPQICIKDIHLDGLGESPDISYLSFEPTHPKENCVDVCVSIRRASR